MKAILISILILLAPAIYADIPCEGCGHDEKDAATFNTATSAVLEARGIDPENKTIRFVAKTDVIGGTRDWRVYRLDFSIFHDGEYADGYCTMHINSRLDDVKMAQNAIKHAFSEK